MSTVVINSRVGQYHRVERVERTERVRVVSQPNYVARRVAAAGVAVVALFAAFTMMSSVITALAGQPAQAAASAPVAVSVSDAAVSHVAVSGDSLWSIADQYRGDVSRDRYVDALVRLNGGTGIVVGQAVQLP